MEELFLYIILFYEEIVSKDFYQQKLNALFLETPENEILLDLEWETDRNRAITYIKTHVDHSVFNYELFGTLLMKELKKYYNCCADIKKFADKMYQLWENLPDAIKDKQPFFQLSYADDPLSWGDEIQTRTIYEKMFNKTNED